MLSNICAGIFSRKFVNLVAKKKKKKKKKTQTKKKKREKREARTL